MKQRLDLDTIQLEIDEYGDLAIGVTNDGDHYQWYLVPDQAVHWIKAHWTPQPPRVSVTKAGAELKRMWAKMWQPVIERALRKQTPFARLEGTDAEGPEMR